jgi:hypothetical protein
VRVRAPLIPDVALVELPPMKSGKAHMSGQRAPRALRIGKIRILTVLVEQQNISAGEVDGVSGAQAGDCSFPESVASPEAWRQKEAYGQRRRR